MFEKSEMLYIYVETPLHAGSGSSVGVVDLPIQRERVTNYPLVQASGIKGKLRAEASDTLKRKGDPDAERKVTIVFGPDSQSGSDHAGALSPGDARLLLFPVRSLKGVFAWTTSVNVLARFQRDMKAVKPKQPLDWTVPSSPEEGQALTVDSQSVVVGDKVVLEEFAFTATADNGVKYIAEWLSNNAFPDSDEYRYFRNKVKTNLVILPEEAFRDFTQFTTEVVARIRIDQDKKTVAQGALWTEEHLPSDTLLYAPLHATRPRTDNTPTDLKNAEDVLKLVTGLGLDRIQLGGDETVGRGIVKLWFGGEQA